MSAPEIEDRQGMPEAGQEPRRFFLEAFACTGYLSGAVGVLFFGSGGFSMDPVAGYGLMLAVVGCLCWAAAGRTILGIGAFILLGLFFYIGNDPVGVIQYMADGLGPTYFGCCRQ